MKSSLLSLLLALAAASSTLACQDNDNMRAEVLLCESAVAHISECCGAQPDIQCKYAYKDTAPLCMAEEGCDSVTEVTPDLSEEESQKIRSLDCETIVAHHDCSGWKQ